MKLSFIPKHTKYQLSDYNIMYDSRTIPYNGKPIIYLQVEPEAVIPYRDYLLKNWNLYFKIFTYDHVLLEKCPNAVKYIFGSNTIGYIPKNISKKEFKISSLTGDKDSLIGHRLRKTLYNNQSMFPDNFVFFASHKATTLTITDKNPKIYDSKIPLFETFQFSIVIECSQQHNYFTEKLIDCLLTKTIPVYWGCPNIGEYFDTTGWIFFNDLDIPKLTPDHYNKYIDIVEKNNLTSIKYGSFYKNLERSGLLINY